MSRLHSLLATLRIANAPSVVSNVWLGVVLAEILFPSTGGGSAAFHWDAACLPALAGLLLYFAGNLANDWFDLDWDRERRPERALPSGYFPTWSYLIAALVSAALGTAAAFAASTLAGLAAVFILLCITIYTWIHKRSAWSVIPMGLCRAGLYVLGFVSWVSWDGLTARLDRGSAEIALVLFGPITTFCCGLLAYIAGLSMSARYEGMAHPPPGPKVIARALLMLPLLAMPCWLLLLYPAYGWIGMVPFGIWLALCLTRYRRPIPAHVSALLAGIPLVDGIFLLPLGWAFSSELDENAAGVIVAAVPLVAFVLGRALQKLAPAT